MRDAKRTIGSDYQRDWPMYFDAVTGKPPRETCIRALDAFEREWNELGGNADRALLAVDIACGEGRDTREILKRRNRIQWRVLACDTSSDGLERLRASLSKEDQQRVRLSLEAMELIPSACVRGSVASELNVQVDGVDFINASFALPFCRPDDFPRLWDWIVGSLRPGGRFAGQFFGVRDDWRMLRPRSHHSRDEIQNLLTPFEIEWLDEVEKDGDDAMGGTKHHHVFHVVARKR